MRVLELRVPLDPEMKPAEYAKHLRGLSLDDAIAEWHALVPKLERTPVGLPTTNTLARLLMLHHHLENY